MINVWGCLTKNIAGTPFLFTQATHFLYSLMEVT